MRTDTLFTSEIYFSCPENRSQGALGGRHLRLGAQKFQAIFKQNPEIFTKGRQSLQTIKNDKIFVQYKFNCLLFFGIPVEGERMFSSVHKFLSLFRVFRYFLLHQGLPRNILSKTAGHALNIETRLCFILCRGLERVHLDYQAPRK